MVKSYLKYEQTQCFGTVVSTQSNAVWVPNSTSLANGQRNTGAGKTYVGANERVLCWDIKTGELLSTWTEKDCTAEVTCICQSKTDPDIFAVGYGDGSIRLWDSRIATVIIAFNGHRSAVTALAFDSQGVKLASGARDTDIIMWDLISETGLFKLRGHKNQITGIHFIQLPAEKDNDGEANGPESGVNSPNSEPYSEGFILSTSKDAIVKIWDITSQHCIETHVTQSSGECWAIGVSPDFSGCITAGNDGELKVWTLDTAAMRQLANGLQEPSDTNLLHERGTLRRQGGDRTIGVSFHPKADYIIVHGSEKSVELFRIRSTQEVQKSLARKRRRKREKAAATAADSKIQTEEKDVDMGDAEDEAVDPLNAPISEYFVPHVIVRTGGKVRSVDWVVGRTNKNLRLLVATTNNQIELFDVSPIENSKKSKSDEIPEYSRTSSVDLPGHRTDIRAMSLSSDDKMLATASSGSLKIWNIKTQMCLRTLECGYALCCSFLPGDKIVLVGNKSGELELFDIASSALIETIKAHDGPIWTLKVHPDGRSVASGSADKSVKFWNFEVRNEEIPGTRRTVPQLKLVQKRVLKLNDDILSLGFSPDSRLLAVSTLDNNVKVFFVDSLKIFLTLYGHKLPVLNMSISSDSKLIATCSADKNVRIWGLDFGDCHKAFFAHDESIMQVSFVAEPESKEDAHMFFTASKDHTLKTWDGDKFQHIQRLPGHHGEIWALALSRSGDFAVTASHDRSIRVWRQSDEPLFLEEERERELEETYDRNLTETLERDMADEYAAAEQAGESTEVASASKQTSTTLTASERITEALTLCTEDLAVVREADAQAAANPSATHAPPQRHPLLAFRNVSAEQHLLSVFEAVPAPALHDALLLLPFSSLPSLFVFLAIWLEREMNVPLTCRVLFFLLKTHHKQIVASRELRTQLEEIQTRLRECLGRWKEMLGFNMAATKILAERVGQSRVRTIEDSERVEAESGSGKKRAFVNVS